MARTKTAPWDYQRRQPSTASIIAEVEKAERLWDESLRLELPTYEEAIRRIVAYYQMRRGAIELRWRHRFITPWERWENDRGQIDDLVALCDQAKAIARALRVNQCPAC